MMDLTELTLEYEKQKVYSFLSTTWSIIADIDINSEAIRCCGSVRFTIWGVWRALFKRHYWGTCKYSGSKINNRNEIRNGDRYLDEEEKGELEIEDNTSPLIAQKNEITNQDFLYFIATNCPWLSYDFHGTPLSKINDGQNDILYLSAANGGTCRLARTLIEGEEGNYFAEDGAVR